MRPKSHFSAEHTITRAKHGGGSIMQGHQSRSEVMGTWMELNTGGKNTLSSVIDLILGTDLPKLTEELQIPVDEGQYPPTVDCVC